MLAWIPLIVLWFGIGESSKIIVIVLAAFFPILINTISGITSTDPKLIEVGKMYNLSNFKLFTKIYLPSAIPSIFVGLKLGLGISLDGKTICGPDKDRAMIFQEHRLFPWLTITDNISLGLDKSNKEENDKLIREHLKMVKLEEFENAYPNQLSGGMSQRAAIARALINNPKVLLLDEPFGALDALTKIQLQNEILKIWQKEKTTMIMVTHDIEEAIYLADKIIVMSSRPGKIKEIINVDIGKPRDRSSYDFATIKKRVYKHFFDTEDISVEYTI